MSGRRRCEACYWSIGGETDDVVCPACGAPVPLAIPAVGPYHPSQRDPMVLHSGTTRGCDLCQCGTDDDPSAQRGLYSVQRAQHEEAARRDALAHVGGDDPAEAADRIRRWEAAGRRWAGLGDAGRQQAVMGPRR